MNEAVKKAMATASSEAAKGEVTRYVISKLRDAERLRGQQADEQALAEIMEKLDRFLADACNAAIDATQQRKAEKG